MQGESQLGDYLLLEELENFFQLYTHHATSVGCFKTNFQQNFLFENKFY